MPVKSQSFPESAQCRLPLILQKTPSREPSPLLLVSRPPTSPLYSFLQPPLSRCWQTLAPWTQNTPPSPSRNDPKPLSRLSLRPSNSSLYAPPGTWLSLRQTCPHHPVPVCPQTPAPTGLYPSTPDRSPLPNRRPQSIFAVQLPYATSS